MFSQNEEKKATAALSVARRYGTYATLITEADKLLAEAKYADAADKFSAAIKDYPRLSEAYTGRGTVFELQAEKTSNSKEKIILLGKAMSDYGTASIKTPHHLEALEKYFKIHCLLGPLDEIGKTLYRELKTRRAQTEKFTRWHQKELAKYNIYYKPNKMDSVHVLYGLSALVANNAPSAHFYFEQVLLNQPTDLFAWCGLAEISFAPDGENKVLDLNYTNQILNHLIRTHNYPLAYALRSILRYTKKQFDLAASDADQCLQLIDDEAMPNLTRLENGLIVAFNKIPTEAPLTEIDKYKNPEIYFSKAKQALQDTKFTAAYSYASFAIWRLHAEGAIIGEQKLSRVAATATKAQKSLLKVQKHLSDAYHLRCKAALSLDNLNLARLNALPATNYSPTPQEILRKTSAHILELVTEKNKKGDSVKAINLLDYALEIDPTNGNLHLEGGVLLAKIQEFSKALDYLNAARKFLPTDRRTRLEALLINVTAQQKAFLSNKSKKDFDQRFEAFKHELSQVYAQCRTNLEYAQQPVPTEPGAFQLKTIFKAQDSKDLLETINFCNEALHHCPTDFVTLVRRARSHLDLKDLPSAEKDCKSAIEHWNYYPAYWVRAHYYLYKNEKSKARADFITCLTQGRPSSINAFLLDDEAVAMILDLKKKNNSIIGVINDFNKNITSETANSLLQALTLGKREERLAANIDDEKHIPNTGPSEEEHTASIKIMEVGLLAHPADPVVLHHIAWNYFKINDFASAKLYVSLALFLETSDVISHYCLRIKINVRQGKAIEAFNDIKSFNHSLPPDTSPYLPAIDELRKECVLYAKQALDNKEYLKAQWLYMAAQELKSDAEIEAEIKNCATLLNPSLPEEKTLPETQPALTVAKAKPAITPKRPAPPSQNKPRKTKIEFAKEEKSVDGGLELLVAENAKKIAEKLKRDAQKRKARNLKKRKKKSRGNLSPEETPFVQPAIEACVESSSPEPEEPPTPDSPAPLSLDEEKRRLKKEKKLRKQQTKLQAALALSTPAAAPKKILSPVSSTAPTCFKKLTSPDELTSFYLRKFIPEKIIFASGSIPAIIALYIKDLEAQNQKSYLTYLVGGAVIDTVLSKYLENLQAQLTKQPCEILAKFIEQPWLARIRASSKIDDYDYVSELPLNEVEKMGEILGLTPISQRRPNVRSFKLGDTKIDFVNRANLTHLEYEVELRIHGSLFLCWDKSAVENQEQFSFDLKDPSHQGVTDIVLGKLRAPFPKHTYRDPVKILYAFFQQTKRRFEFDAEDEKIIKNIIPKLKIKDKEAVNAQLKILFSYCNLVINYNKLLENNLFDSLFSPYFARCLKADNDWVKNQLQEVSAFAHPNLKGIYAIFIASIAMQELNDETFGDLSFFSRPSIFNNLSVIYTRCRNVILRFPLFNTYFTHELAGDIRLNFNKYFLTLINNWEQTHEVKPQGFKSTFSVTPGKENHIKGFSLLTNTTMEEDMDKYLPLRPRGQQS